MPTLTYAIPVSGFVYGITALGPDIFINRQNSAGVEVYDSTTFLLQRTLPVPVSEPRGVVCCPRYNCLYVGNTGNNIDLIYRVDLGAGNAIMKWKTDISCSLQCGLSINSVYNVLVACSGTNKLQEFTTFGILVREIIFQGKMFSPVHAVQMKNGQYVVSHASPYNNVSIIAVDGKVVHTYGNLHLFGAGPLGIVQNVAVCKNGCILVADSTNNGIVAMNPTLSCAHEVPIPGGLQRPWALCFDESQGRLCVAQCNGILILDNVMMNVGVHMRL